MAKLDGAQVILVVDDEASLLPLLSITLSMRGYVVVTAGSIAEADGIIGQLGTVDVALIDVRLRGEDGNVLAMKLRDMNIPCALMSGDFSDTGSPDNVTLPKPFSAAMIDEALGALQRQRNAR